MKRPRIGDLAIAKFDDCEQLCLITGRSTPFQEFDFIYWEKRGKRTIVHNDALPVGRLRKANVFLKNIGDLRLKK